MDNIYSNIINPNKNNLTSHIDTFIEKIQKSTSELKFINYIENITKLINSLIDICIKNKINYYIQNNISFSSIKSNFIIELENILINIINKLIPDIEKKFVNITTNELNTIETSKQMDEALITLFKKQGNKNRVSFNPTATHYIYKEEGDDTLLKKTKKKSKSVKIDLFSDDSDKIELPNIYKIGLLIKVFFINNLDIMILQQKLYNICKIISDTTVDYNILQPYKNLQK